MTGSVAWGATVGMLYAVLCLGAGASFCFVVGRWVPSCRGRALWIALRFALGHLLLGSLWIPISLGGGFEPPIVAVVCAVFAALSIALFGGSARRRFRGVSLAGRRPRATAVLLAFGAALVLVRALSPPVNDDALRGYLLTARVVAESHQLAFQPFNVFVVWPLLAEMNMAATLLLANETAATVFDGFVGLAFLGAVFGLAQRAGLGRTGALTAVLTLSSSSAFLGLVGAGKVDIAGSLFGVLAASFALQGPGLVAAPWLVGLLFGSAVAVKYSNLFLLPGLLFMLWPRSGGTPWRPLAPAAAGAVLAMAPQLFKNFALTGNPVAPFLGEVFGTAETYWAASLAGDIGGPADFAWFHRLIWPVMLTYGGHTGMLGTVSPLLLGLGPLALRLGLEDPRHRTLAWAAAAILGAWLVIFPWGLIFPRFLFTPIALLSIAAGAIVELGLRAEGLRRAIRVALALCLVLTVFDLRSAAYSLQYVRGVLSGEAIYDRHENAKDWHAIARTLNQRVSETERVFLEMPYGYFLRLDILTRSQSADERQQALASCERRDHVIREGRFSWLVQPTEEFRWLVALTPGCPLPPGFRVVSQTPVAILAVAPPR